MQQEILSQNKNKKRKEKQASCNHSLAAVWGVGIHRGIRGSEGTSGSGPAGSLGHSAGLKTFPAWFFHVCHATLISAPLDISGCRNRLLLHPKAKCRQMKSEVYREASLLGCHPPTHSVHLRLLFLLSSSSSFLFFTILLLKVSWGQREGSAGKGSCFKSVNLNSINAQSPHGGRRELTPSSLLHRSALACASPCPNK